MNVMTRKPGIVLLCAILWSVAAQESPAQTRSKIRRYNRTANIHSSPESLAEVPVVSPEQDGRDLANLRESLSQDEDYVNSVKLPMSGAIPFNGRPRPAPRNTARTGENWLLPVSTPNEEDGDMLGSGPMREDKTTGWGWLADDVQTTLQTVETPAEQDGQDAAVTDEDTYEDPTTWTEEHCSRGTTSDKPTGGLLLDNNYRPTEGLARDLEYAPSGGTLIVDDRVEVAAPKEMSMEPVLRNRNETVVQTDRVSWGEPVWNQNSETDAMLNQTRALLGESQLKGITASSQAVLQPSYSSSAQLPSSGAQGLFKPRTPQISVQPVGSSVSSFSGSSASFKPVIDAYPASSGMQPIFESALSE